MKKHEPQKSTVSGWKVFGIVFVVVTLTFFAVKFMNGNSPTATAPMPTLGENQVIRMAVDGNAYKPSTLTVKEGPVQWIIDGTKAVGCTQYILSQELGISKKLEKGDNIITFTPPRKGTFRFSCGMGMVDGTINVV